LKFPAVGGSGLDTLKRAAQASEINSPLQ